MLVKYLNRHRIEFKLFFMQRPKKVLFEHIPKCGGTTLTEYLKSQYIKRRIFDLGSTPSKSIDYFISLPEKKRYSYDLILGHGAHRLRKYVGPEVLKTTIFRDPVDRIISHYFFVLRSPQHYLYKELKSKSMSLADYATSGLSGELRNNYVCRFLQISAMEAEMSPEESIMRAYDVLREEYSVIGILESFDVAISHLAKSASFHNSFRPNKINAMAVRPKIDDIDQVTLSTIEETNCLDVKLYKLIKGLLNIETKSV